MKYISSIKNYSLILIILTLVIGLMFLIFPEQSRDMISLVIGISLISAGLIGIINYFVKDKFKGTLITGIITIIFGIIICSNIIPIINIIIGILGVMLILFGVFNLGVSIRIIAASLLFGWTSLVLSLVCIGFGVFAVMNINETTVAVFRLLGIALIVYSVLDIITFIQVKRLYKKINTAVDVAVSDTEIETEGTIIE